MHPASTQLHAVQRPGHVRAVDCPGLRVIVSEHNVLRREGTAAVIARAGFEVVGQASDPTELLALVRTHRPELVIVDMGLNAVEATEANSVAVTIHEELPEIGLLVLSDEFNENHVLELSWGRGIGYLLKSYIVNPSVLVDALERIAGGGVVLDPGIVQCLAQARRAHDPLAALSARERDVLALVAEGLSNIGIARQIYISEGTVEKYVSRILSKLELPEGIDHHRRVLAAIAFRRCA